MAKVNETKQLEAAMAPVVAFNKLVVKGAENAFNLQMASLQAYAKMGLENLNAGLEVLSAEDFKTYAERQKGLAQEIAARATSDVKYMSELNGKFIEDARNLAEENIKVATTKVAA